MADRHGCLIHQCEEGGPICGCAYISSRGNPYGKHIRLTECLPVVLKGDGPEQVYANCKEGKEMPVITEELHCERVCMVGSDCVPDPVGEVCDDDIDNDCDGFIDCSDSDCDTEPQCIGRECETDPDCAAGEMCDETTGQCIPSVEICGDAIDNDGDGLIDCLDSDCDTEPECNLCDPNPCQPGEICDPTTGQCLPPVEICADGIDNDGDGLIDCLDTDCDVDQSCQCDPPCVAGEFCSLNECMPIP
jgi:hypothetical protein